MRRVDIATGVIILAFGAFALWQSLMLDLFQRRGVPGPGMFPALLALGLMLLGGLLVVTRGLGAHKDFGHFSLPAPSDLARPALASAALLGSAVLLPIVGFLPAMVALVAVLLLGVERLRGLWALATIVLLPALFYVIFAVLLKVRLPTGIFG